MFNYIFGLALIFLSILPNFQGKLELEKNVKSKILNNKTNEEIGNGTKYKISKIPEKEDIYADLTLSAKAAVFIDAESGKILFEKNKDKRLPMASITKLMTALIAYEKLDQNQIVTVPTLKIYPLDSVMGISTGEKFKVIELLHGLIIESGADAAQTLVAAATGDENQFVAIMNEKASLLGLSNTQFTNTVGYDETGHYSSAYDLSKLAKIFLKNETLSKIATKKYYISVSESGKKYSLTNTNQLLNGTTYKGLKTGTTFAAGECLVSYYENSNQKIIGIVLGSPSRFYETNNAIEWIKKVFSWSSVIE